MDFYLFGDSHFYHDKPFIYAARGFQNIDEMNEAIVERWNKTIKDNDIVIHLGDVMLGEAIEEHFNIVKRLRGKKYLIYGNHDTEVKLALYKEHNIFEDIQMGCRMRWSKKKSLILTHYPTIVSNTTKDNIINFFAHTHQKTVYYEDAGGIHYNMYNAGADAHDCYPVAIEEALAEINLDKRI